KIFGGKGDRMVKVAFRGGLSAFVIWGMALTAAPAQERLAQSAPLPRVQGTPAPRAGQPHTPGQQAPPAQPVAAAPQVPTRVEILNFDNWAVTCNEFADGPRTKRCSAMLHIMQQNTNQTVFTWTVGIDDKKQLVAIFQTPTGVVIAPGVEL